MKKKSIVFIIIFIVLLLLPAVTMPLFYNSENTEKRKLADFPEIMGEEGLNKDFVSQFDEWVNDRIGFRSPLVVINTELKAKIFNYSAEDGVIMGKDGWLFFSDTVDDYMNVQTLSDRNINNISNTLKLVQDELEEEGVEFAFTVIPNKSTVYPEYMSGYYVVNDNSNGNLEALAEAVKAKNVNYADVYSALSSDDRVLYQKTDSHWTYEGALVGYRTIIDAIADEYMTFDGIGFNEVNDWDGDLAGMLYSTSAKKDNQMYADYEFEYEYSSHDKAPDSLLLKTENANGTGSAVIYRDSFMNAGHVYFAENFGNAVFSRAIPYNLGLVEQNEASTVVIEIVERNIRNLAMRAPMIEAPLCDADVIGGEDGTLIKVDEFDIYETKAGSKMQQVYGVIDENLLSEDYDVFIKAGDQIYQMFPIFEKDLLESEDMGDNGFSGYFAEDNSIDISQAELFIRNNK